MPAIPNPLALAVMLPLIAAWTVLVSTLRALDAALALLLAEPGDLDERGSWA